LSNDQANPLCNELRDLATSSFRTSIATLRSFEMEQAAVDTAERQIKKPRTAFDETQHTYVVYFRQYTYPSPQALMSSIHSYVEAFPGDCVWATTCLEELESMTYRGEVHLKYAGATTRSASLRLREDNKTEYRRWANWQSEYSHSL
jgi:hypothetical protein